MACQRPYAALDGSLVAHVHLPRNVCVEKLIAYVQHVVHHPHAHRATSSHLYFKRYALFAWVQCGLMDHANNRVFTVAPLFCPHTHSHAYGLMITKALNSHTKLIPDNFTLITLTAYTPRCTPVSMGARGAHEPCHHHRVFTAARCFTLSYSPHTYGLMTSLTPLLNIYPMVTPQQGGGVDTPHAVCLLAWVPGCLMIHATITEFTAVPCFTSHNHTMA